MGWKGGRSDGEVIRPPNGGRRRPLWQRGREEGGAWDGVDRGGGADDVAMRGGPGGWGNDHEATVGWGGGGGGGGRGERAAVRRCAVRMRDPGDVTRPEVRDQGPRDVTKGRDQGM